VPESNAMQIFKNNEFGEIRIIEQDGAHWFVAKDIADILEYSDANKMVQRLDDDEKANRQLGGLTVSKGGRGMIVINESGLYNAILGSQKPESKKFKKWVTSEVLPTIRKTGGYVANSDMFIECHFSNMQPIQKDILKMMLDSSLESQKEIITLKNQILLDEPKIVLADAVTGSATSIMVGDLAKLISQNNFAIGQMRLYFWLRQEGWLMKIGKSANFPTQKAMESKYLELQEFPAYSKKGKPVIYMRTIVTGRGQMFFINKFLNKKWDGDTLVAA